jgi:mono/diheme cytochrome c family protein
MGDCFQMAGTTRGNNFAQGGMVNVLPALRQAPTATFDRDQSAPAAESISYFCNPVRSAGRRFVTRRTEAVSRAKRRPWIILIGVAATLAAAPPPPDLPGDPAAGYRLAQSSCSSCHLIDRSQATIGPNGAPTFSAVARMSSTTPISLRVFLQSPHSKMPNLKLTHDEIDDLVAYILSLKGE